MFLVAENPDTNELRSTSAKCETTYTFGGTNFPMHMAWHVAPSLQAIFTPHSSIGL